MNIISTNPEAGLQQFSGIEARELITAGITRTAAAITGGRAPLPSEVRGFKAAILAGLASTGNATLSLGAAHLDGWNFPVSDIAFGAGVRISDGETYFRVDLVIDPAATPVQTSMRGRGGSTSFDRPVFIEKHAQELLDTMGQALATASGTPVYMKATA